MHPAQAQLQSLCITCSFAVCCLSGMLSCHHVCHLPSLLLDQNQLPPARNFWEQLAACASVRHRPDTSADAAAVLSRACHAASRPLAPHPGIQHWPTCNVHGCCLLPKGAPCCCNQGCSLPAQTHIPQLQQGTPGCMGKSQLHAVALTAGHVNVDGCCRQSRPPQVPARLSCQRRTGRGP